jgi:type VI secretion system protein
VGLGLALLTTACLLPVSQTRVTLHVHVAPDANQNAPIPVDLVFAYEQGVADALAELGAGEWFARKAQMRRDDPDRQAFEVWEWEWVPGQEVPAIEQSVPAGARRWVRGIFVFANYRSAGPHRLRLSAGSSSLALLSTDVALLDGTAASSR